MSKSILMIVTSHNRIDDEHPTGIWFEEFSIPYSLFNNQGYRVTVASPLGGAAPVDPGSLEDIEATEQNEKAKNVLDETLKLTADLSASDYDALFFPGGHGTMFDLPDNRDVQRLIRDVDAAGKPVAAVCHGPCCFVNVVRENGTLFVIGREMTAFTDSEEKAVALDNKMPFLLESRLRELGANFKAAPDWSDNTIIDGNLITGQNPQSSGSAARALIDLLESKS